MPIKGIAGLSSFSHPQSSETAAELPDDRVIPNIFTESTTQKSVKDLMIY